jgi:hypothetical protein
MKSLNPAPTFVASIQNGSLCYKRVEKKLGTMFSFASKELPTNFDIKGVVFCQLDHNNLIDAITIKFDAFTIIRLTQSVHANISQAISD